MTTIDLAAQRAAVISDQVRAYDPGRDNRFLIIATTSSGSGLCWSHRPTRRGADMLARKWVRLGSADAEVVDRADAGSPSVTGLHLPEGKSRA